MKTTLERRLVIGEMVTSVLTSAAKSGAGLVPPPERKRMIADRGGHLPVVACAGAWAKLGGLESA